MNKPIGIVAGMVTALILSGGTAKAADFLALQNLDPSSISPMTESELETVVGACSEHKVGPNDDSQSP